MKLSTLTKTTNTLLLTILTVASCFGQKNNSQNKSQSSYSNWMSVDYLNCLKTSLPCECEKLNEYFIISLDTTKNFALLYEGKANYDYSLYDFQAISKDNFKVYTKEYSQETIVTIGQIKIKNDKLLFISPSGKQTQFVMYGTGDNDSYFKEHIKLLNEALALRGYESLNKILQSDGLKCWCNWELEGGMNSVFESDKGEWILEKKGNELFIYEWINPPIEKMADLKMEKKLLKKLKW